MGQALDILRNSLANHGGTNIHISIYWIYKSIKNYMFHSVSCIAENLCEPHYNSLCFYITFLAFYQNAPKPCELLLFWQAGATAPKAL